MKCTPRILQAHITIAPASQPGHLLLGKSQETSAHFHLDSGHPVKASPVQSSPVHPDLSLPWFQLPHQDTSYAEQSRKTWTASSSALAVLPGYPLQKHPRNPPTHVHLSSICWNAPYMEIQQTLPAHMELGLQGSHKVTHCKRDPRDLSLHPLQYQLYYPDILCTESLITAQAHIHSSSRHPTRKASGPSSHTSQIDQTHSVHRGQPYEK